MTCAPGPACHHQADCADLACHGRPTGRNTPATRAPGNVYTDWLIGCAVVILLAASINLDLYDASAERATAQALEDAIRAEKAATRFARAAADLCGPNAGWVELQGGAIQCTLHTGRATGRPLGKPAQMAQTTAAQGR